MATKKHHVHLSLSITIIDSICFHVHAGVEDWLCLVDEYLLAEIEENYCTVPNMAGPEFSAIADVTDRQCLQYYYNFLYNMFHTYGKVT